MYASLMTALVAPVSRGSVTISSADTAVLPIIDPAFLVSPADQEVALAAFKRARDFFAAKALQPVLIGEEYDPGPSVATDAQILHWIRSNVMTVWHSSSTCAMGRSSNPLAVVDNHAKVIGVSNLRVVDASAFPLLPPGHPQSTVCMLRVIVCRDEIKLTDFRCSCGENCGYDQKRKLIICFEYGYNIISWKRNAGEFQCFVDGKHCEVCNVIKG
jgi:choline dehydrogenase-like flavoprotein